MIKRLFYVHMASVQPSESGGLNTTLIQVFSMCNAFVRAGYNVTLGMQKNKGFEKNSKNFINNSFKEGVDFQIKTWNQISTNLFLNRIIVKSKIIKIVKLNRI